MGSSFSLRALWSPDEPGVFGPQATSNCAPIGVYIKNKPGKIIPPGCALMPNSIVRVKAQPGKTTPNPS
jgi:hypothetical protein